MKRKRSPNRNLYKLCFIFVRVFLSDGSSFWVQMFIVFWDLLAQLHGAKNKSCLPLFENGNQSNRSPANEVDPLRLRPSRVTIEQVKHGETDQELLADAADDGRSYKLHELPNVQFQDVPNPPQFSKPRTYKHVSTHFTQTLHSCAAQKTERIITAVSKIRKSRDIGTSNTWDKFRRTLCPAECDAPRPHNVRSLTEPHSVHNS